VIGNSNEICSSPSVPNRQVTRNLERAWRFDVVPPKGDKSSQLWQQLSVSGSVVLGSRRCEHGPRRRHHAGETLRRAHSTPRSGPSRRPLGLLSPLGCVTHEINDDTLEVIVPDAPSESQGRRELHLYLETWRARHPGLELELLDWSE
jgi:hypothetical protein